MKKEWFEPGLDGKSPFVKAYRKAIDEGLLVGHSISAAFRALLAEDAQQSECGKVVQVPEAVSSNVAAFIRSKDDEIAKLRAEVKRLTAELRACADERMAAEIERDAADEFVKRVTAERDALQARVDAGVRVRSIGSGTWCVGPWAPDTRTALLIDKQPLDHIVEPNKMVDERVTPGTRADRSPS